jgi:TP901 family phage tail tape measure protein
VEAVLKPTTRELGELEKQAKLLGRTTRFTAREAGDTIEVLARNGLKTNQILGGVLEASLSLAASVGAELPAAADTMTDVLQVFNLEAEESRKN